MFFIFNTRELSLNMKDLRASTLVDLTRKSPVLYPIAVQHYDNRLNMICPLMRNIIFERSQSDVHSQLFFSGKPMSRKDIFKISAHKTFCIKTKACQEDEAELSNSTVDYDENWQHNPLQCQALSLEEDQAQALNCLISNLLVKLLAY